MALILFNDCERLRYARPSSANNFLMAAKENAYERMLFFSTTQSCIARLHPFFFHPCLLQYPITLEYVLSMCFAIFIQGIDLKFA